MALSSMRMRIGQDGSGGCGLRTKRDEFIYQATIHSIILPSHSMRLQLSLGLGDFSHANNRAGGKVQSPQPPPLNLQQASTSGAVSPFC